MTDNAQRASDGPQETCGMCGRTPAEGFAMFGDIRYCHGDDGPSCYENVTYDHAAWNELVTGEERRD